MAKSTRSPLQQFFAKSLKMARSRDKMNNRVSDDNVTIDYLCGLYYGQNALCFHTGEIMTIERGLIDGIPCFTLCTMDRIDNAQGYNVGNIIIITCIPLDKKIQMLNKYLILKKITHVQNINSLITICLFKKI